MCMHVWAQPHVCVYVLKGSRQVRWVGAPLVSVLTVLWESRTEAVSDTLVCSLLAPLGGRSTQASPGESGGPLGTGQDWDREGVAQYEGQAFSLSEKKRNQIQAKSPSIYCILHLSRATSWKESCEGNCTMGPGRTREGIREERRDAVNHDRLFILTAYS